MNRPEVRIIEPQQSTETKEVSVLDWEAQQLLQKYGFRPDQVQVPIVPQPVNNPQADLSFEDMVRLEELERNRELEIQRRRNYPDPNYNNTNYVTDPDSGFNYKIEIRTEGGLKIPR